MFNVTVLKMRDIVKYLVGFMIIIGIIVYATRFFSIRQGINKIKLKPIVYKRKLKRKIKK